MYQARFFIVCPLTSITNDEVGIGQDQQIFTVSMNFRKKKQPIASGGEFARGFLDDSLLISFGLGDRSSHFVEVRVKDVLKDHTICSDIMKDDNDDD